MTDLTVPWQMLLFARVVWGVVWGFAAITVIAHTGHRAQPVRAALIQTHGMFSIGDVGARRLRLPHGIAALA